MNATVNVDAFIAAVRAALAPHGLSEAQINTIIVKLVSALPHG
jgi:hypothetical protein